jgi:hypothetical protein
VIRVRRCQAPPKKKTAPERCVWLDYAAK